MVNLRFTSEVGVQGSGSPSQTTATDGTFLAFAVPGTPTVELCRLQALHQAPVRLSSDMQRRPVISLCFGTGHMGSSDPVVRARAGSASARGAPCLLFCGSADAVVAWNISAVLESIAVAGPPPSPVQVVADQGPVYCMTYSAHLSYLVVCAGADVHVYDVRTFRHVFTLDGHAADVLAASFCAPPAPPHLLVTAGADRTFKIWDLDAGSLVFQSAVLGASPLTAAAMEPAFPPRLVLGGADGCLRFFDLSSLPAARPLQLVDVGRHVARAVDAAAAAAAEAAAAAAQGPKVISSRPNWKAQMGLQRQPSSSGSETDRLAAGEEEGGPADSSTNPYILSLCYVPVAGAAGAARGQRGQGGGALPALTGGQGSAGWGGEDEEEGGGGAALLPPCPSLLVGLPGAVVVVCTRTYEVTHAFLLGRPEAVGAAAGGGSRGGLAGLPAGSLTAPPPPPPGARPRLVLRGLPRVEPSGCMAFAPLAAGAGSGGQAGAATVVSAGGGGAGAGPRSGVVVCSASATEPTVAVLTYEEDGGGGGTGGAASAARSLSRNASGGSAAAASRRGSREGGGDGGGSNGWDGEDAAGYAGGDGGYEEGPGGADGGGDGDDAGPLSVFQTRPLPEDSPLRAAGAGTASASSSASSSRRASSAGHMRPGGAAGGGRSGSGSGAGAPPVSRTSSGSSGRSGSGAGGGSGRFASPGRAARPPGGGSSSGKGAGGGGKGGLLDKPVTFHQKVKSSGYGFVQPSHQLGRPPPAPVKLPPRAAASSSVNRHMADARQYPLDCGPLNQHQPKNALPGGQPVHPGGAIVRVAYSSDASRLLTASVNRTARVMKLPLSRHAGEGTDLVGHNAPLHSADWSREGTMVLTASADRTARLWNAACAQPLLEFTHLNTQPPRNPSAPHGPASTAPSPASPARPPSAAARAPNPLLPHEVRAARFLYMDQLVALACGNKLLLYRYKLADEPDSDIERLRNRHSYRLAASYASPAQALLDFSVVNSFLSPLAIASASNRGLELVDLAVMRQAAAVGDAHARPVGCVAQAGCASLFTSHPREAYELFATAAPDNAVKLWDVRNPTRCVRAFAGHRNSQLPNMAVSFSPCLRYLGVGSEDKVAYLYDVRQGIVAQRVRGAPHDVVTGVAFNPLHPQMAVACLDGRVHFYAAAGEG